MSQEMMKGNQCMGMSMEGGRYSTGTSVLSAKENGKEPVNEGKNQ